MAYILRQLLIFNGTLFSWEQFLNVKRTQPYRRGRNSTYSAQQQRLTPNSVLSNPARFHDISWKLLITTEYNNIFEVLEKFLETRIFERRVESYSFLKFLYLAEEIHDRRHLFKSFIDFLCKTRRKTEIQMFYLKISVYYLTRQKGKMNGMRWTEQVLNNFFPNAVIKKKLFSSKWSSQIHSKK